MSVRTSGGGCFRADLTHCSEYSPSVSVRVERTSGQVRSAQVETLDRDRGKNVQETIELDPNVIFATWLTC